MPAETPTPKTNRFLRAFSLACFTVTACALLLAGAVGSVAGCISVLRWAARLLAGG